MNQPAVPAGPLALQRQGPARVIDLTALVPTPRAGPYELTVIVPMRNEAANVAPLLARVTVALEGIDAEVLFVDDGEDDTADVVLRAAARSSFPIRVVHRTPTERKGSLSGAVQRGLACTDATWVVVMDSDLQDPPELIPRLLAEGIARDLDVVVARRYQPDGTAEGPSSPLRKLGSPGVTYLARATFPRLLRRVNDPMSGFFAVRREVVDTQALRPHGFTILLEILARSSAKRVAEVAFPLGERHEQQSNASARQLVSYLRQLIALRLAISGALLSAFLKFSAVGASGVAVNTFLLWLLTQRISHLPYLAAAFLATQIAIVWNFTLLEGLVFRREQQQTRARRFGKFWLLNLGLLPVQLALLAFGVEALKAEPVVTNAVVLGFVFGLRYAATTCWVYRDQNVAALNQPTVGRTASSYRSTLRYSLRLALPPVATLVVYPNLVLSFGALGLGSLSLALLAMAAWSALWVRSSAPRPGEPDVHDRQVDIILGIPVLAVAVWLSLSSMNGSALATPLTNSGTIALPLFLTGTSLLLLGTRMTSRMRWVLVLPLLLLPAFTARPGLVGFLLVTAALLATGRHARGRRHRTDRLSTRERWPLSRQQQLPRVKRALAVVSVVALALPLSAVLAHSPHAPSHLLTPGSASANAAPHR